MEYKPQGELLWRLERSFARLHADWYRPDQIFTADQDGWPADWEGRAVLALTLLGKALKREPAYLEAILEGVKSRLNRDGYLGEILPEGELDEQQLSGHNWLMRGLMEYGLWKGDGPVRGMMERMVENLYLKSAGRFASYPTDPAQRVMAGKAAGNRTGHSIGGWRTSTDIGCAYMSLDAMSQYYALYGDERVKALTEEMIACFARIDLTGLSMQTHATLSALRGVLRHYESTGDARLLALVKSRFDLYRKQGMTETYANYNWFGRPDWTEPCAIVDSFLLALNLYRLTREGDYLSLAHRIYYNALSIAQRDNGGFGCDNCAGAGDVTATIGLQIYEAYWCCTMRGGEGLYAAASNWAARSGDALDILFFHEGELEEDGVKLTLSGGYPARGELNLTAARAEDSPVRRLRLFIPSFLWDCAFALNGAEIPREGDFLTLPLPQGNHEFALTFPLPLRREPTVGENTLPGYFVWWRGPAILGKNSAGELVPLRDVVGEQGRKPEDATFQILFPA